MGKSEKTKPETDAELAARGLARGGDGHIMPIVLHPEKEHARWVAEREALGKASAREERSEAATPIAIQIVMTPPKPA